MSKPQVYSEDGTLKRCSKCDTMKPLDSFSRRKLKSGGFGFASWCRCCAVAKTNVDTMAKYRNEPEWREKKLAKDRERGAAKRKAHRNANPLVLLTPEERLEHQRESYRKSAARPEARERAKIRTRNYRALKKFQAEGEPITKEIWNAIVAKHNGCCAYCKVETPYLELDHVVPLSRGGKHAVENIVPACRACNTSKNNRTLDEWTPPTEPQIILRCRARRGAWKLTDAQVVEMRLLRSLGYRAIDLAVQFGVNEQHVSEICIGKVRPDAGGLFHRAGRWG